MWTVWTMAMAGTPQQVELTYRVSFDLDATADSACSITQICDCSALYVGAGKRVESVGDRLTFEGTWKLAESNCNQVFAIWVPADGKAFHSFRVGTALSEWVVHGQRSNHTKRTSAIKENQQFWIDELQQAWPIKTAQITQTDQGSLGMGMRLKTSHLLALQFVD